MAALKPAIPALVMAITECPNVMPPVDHFTVAPEPSASIAAPAIGWSIRWLDGERS